MMTYSVKSPVRYIAMTLLERINQLNNMLDGIMKKELELIKWKMLYDINQEIIKETIDVKSRLSIKDGIDNNVDIEKSVKELNEEIKEYLKNVEINEDIEYEIAKEIKAEELDENWINITYE